MVNFLEEIVYSISNIRFFSFIIECHSMGYFHGYNSRKGGKLKVSLGSIWVQFLYILLVLFLAFRLDYTYYLELFHSLLLGLAISFKLLRNDMNYFILIGISIGIFIVSYIVWFLLVHNVDDYYIFYPFTFFMFIN